MKNSNKFISLIIPSFNEGESITELISQLKELKEKKI